MKTYRACVEVGTCVRSVEFDVYDEDLEDLDEQGKQDLLSDYAHEEIGKSGLVSIWAEEVV